MTRILLSLALRLTPAARAEFPIGLYNVAAPETLGTIAEAGFTHVLPLSNQDELTLAARRYGLKVVGVPGANQRPRSDGVPDPAAWYICDEPDVNGVTPAALAATAQALRSATPSVPLVLVVGDGARAKEYSSSVDALMVDWYPVPHLPLAGLGEHVGAAVSQVPDKPVWAVVQAMDWRDYPQRDPKRPRIGRFPSFGELRFMSYHALAKGARGLFFFEFQRRSAPGQTLLDSPEYWQALRRVALEVHGLLPFIAGSPGEAPAYRGLEARRWRHGRKELLVLLNPGPGPQPLPAELLNGGWRPVYELSAALASAPLAPYRVLVLTRR